MHGALVLRKHTPSGRYVSSPSPARETILFWKSNASSENTCWTTRCTLRDAWQTELCNIIGTRGSREAAVCGQQVGLVQQRSADTVQELGLILFDWDA